MALFGKKKKNEAAEEKKQETTQETAASETSTLDLIKETMEEAKEERHAQLLQETEAAQAAAQQNTQPQGAPSAEEIRKAQEVLARAQQAQASQIPGGAKVGVNAPVNTENLKAVINKFQQAKTQENLKLVMDCLQKPQTLVCVPAGIVTSKENQEKLRKGGENGGQVKLEGPVHINPVLLTDNTGKKVFPIFSSEDEIPEDLRKKTPKVNMPLGQCLNIMKGIPDVDTFALNPYTANIRIGVNIEQKKQ